MKRIPSILWAAACAALVICPTRTVGANDTWTVAYKGALKGRREHTVTHAASKLSHYMGRVLGVEVKAVPWEKAEGENLFLILDAGGAPKPIAQELDGKRGDAFLIRYPYRIDGKKVCLLASHDSHGYDYPVYYFLRNFVGVDWVGPGAIGEVVPSNPEWRMPARISVLENPDFEMRYWGDYKFSHARPLLAGSHRMDFHHAFGNIYAPKKYAKTDPDVYPLIAGKRRPPDPDAVATAGWQPCVGNPKTQEMAVRWVLDRFAKDPTTVSVSLSVNDGGANDCMCDLCRAMDAKDAFRDPLNPNLSDRYFRFYNTVIDRVLKVKPNAYVAVLGYGPCGRPPVETKIHDRVCVFISTGANPRQFAGAGGRSSLYHYHLDNAYPTIRHYPHMIARYLRESKRAGGMGYYAQIEHSWAAGGPKTYVLAHLLWDVNSDVDALLDRYMRLAFGEQAAVPMRSYFDRWEEIWRREAAELENPYDTIYMWSSDHIRKFRFVRWEDLHYLDAAMDIARKAPMTSRQTERLDLFGTYYRWIRCSLAQALMTRDLANPGWVASRPARDVLDRVETALERTDEFDEIWEQKIAADRSGWLLNQKSRLVAAVAKGGRYYDSLLVGPIRAEVEAELAKGIGVALQGVSASTGKGGNKEKAVAFWKKELQTRQQLKPFIQPEINRLLGVVPKNLVRNGGFEEGEPGGPEAGQPPRLPGWWFYDRVGMVLDSKSVYGWSTTQSRDGSKSIGCGPGKYPGLRGFVELDAGRYRFSVRYKTVRRKVPIEVSLYLLTKDVRVGKLTSPEAVRRLTNDQYIKFLRRSWPPTESKWRQISQTFDLDEKRALAITLEPFYMEKDAWCWFDDVEVVRLY